MEAQRDGAMGAARKAWSVERRGGMNMRQGWGRREWHATARTAHGGPNDMWRVQRGRPTVLSATGGDTHLEHV